MRTVLATSHVLLLLLLGDSGEKESKCTGDIIEPNWGLTCIQPNVGGRGRRGDERVERRKGVIKEISKLEKKKNNVEPIRKARRSSSNGADSRLPSTGAG